VPWRVSTACQIQPFFLIFSYPFDNQKGKIYQHALLIKIATKSGFDDGIICPSFLISRIEKERLNLYCFCL
jgi:hypothetical protein